MLTDLSLYTYEILLKSNTGLTTCSIILEVNYTAEALPPPKKKVFMKKSRGRDLVLFELRLTTLFSSLPYPP